MSVGCPYLTLFAASIGGIDMASEPGARTVLDAMSDPGISDAERFQMTAIIMRLASDAARQFLEATMHTSEYAKTFPGPEWRWLVPVRGGGDCREVRLASGRGCG
jgi:hypothetical protein